jgi:hypothetical protein
MGGTKCGLSPSLSKPNTYPPIPISYHNDWQYGVRVLSTGPSSPAYRAKAAAKPAMPTKACAATVTIGMAPALEEAEDAAEAEDATAEEDAMAEEADAAMDDAALEAEDATLDAEASTDEATLEAEADLDDASLAAEADLDASEALEELALAAVPVIEL